VAARPDQAGQAQAWPLGQLYSQPRGLAFKLAAIDGLSLIASLGQMPLFIRIRTPGRRAYRQHEDQNTDPKYEDNERDSD
jgi:hypothetical protein